MNFWERDNFDVHNSGANTANQNREQDLKQKFEEYSSKSEDQLMSELSSMAERMKKDGTFDKAALENMYNTASPYLNEMQRQRMRQLINMLVG